MQSTPLSLFSQVADPRRNYDERSGKTRGSVLSQPRTHSVITFSCVRRPPPCQA